MSFKLLDKSPRGKFLGLQADILDKHGITFRSINVELVLDESTGKFKKKPVFDVSYKDKTLTRSFNSSRNSTFIPMGTNYGGLIGIDVDNKNDTIEFFYNLLRENNYAINTLTVKTINEGKHFYFRLNEQQQNELKDFRSADGKCFSTQEHPIYIDVKYTNQILFGPSYFQKDKNVFKYVIENDCKPVELPDFIYQEILRVHNPKSVPNKIKQKNDVKETNRTTNESPAPETIPTVPNINIDSRLAIYLDALNSKRFDDRNDWLIIGSVIFNESGTFELFEKYSMKSAKYDKKGCVELWKSFKRERKKKTTLKRLIELVEEDLENNPDEYMKVLIKDKTGLINELFNNEPSDLYLSYLFYDNQKDNFIFNNGKWYSSNNNGIFFMERNATTLKKRILPCLKLILCREYKELHKLHNGDSKKMDKLNGKYRDLTNFISHSRNINSIAESLKVPFEINDDCILNKNPALIGFNNGVYDIETGEFRNANLNEYITITTGYSYEKADVSKKKEAMNIFKSIFPDDNELKFVLKHISLGLLGENPEEKFFIWEGSGSNGKGVLRDIIKVVLGNYYDTLDISYLYKTSKKDANAANSVMAKKKYTRFVVSTEPEIDQTLNGDLIKSLSGNDEQQVRSLYGEPFNYTPAFKMVIQTNNEPVFDNFDGGLKRRITLIKFPMKFVENPSLPHERKINMNLKRMITKDKTYNNEFFEILAEHYILYKKEGLNLPKRIKQDTYKLIRDNDPFDEWFNRNICVSGNKKDCIKMKTLYNNFVAFMGGTDEGLSQTAIKKMMIQKGIVNKRKEDGIYCIGIKLKESVDIRFIDEDEEDNEEVDEEDKDEDEENEDDEEVDDEDEDEDEEDEDEDDDNEYETTAEYSESQGSN